MTILTSKLEKWFLNEGSIADYREAIHLLKRSGLLDILRRKGTPSIIELGESPYIMAGQAHFAAGYQMALDHIEDFEEIFRGQAAASILSPPDFGAEQDAISKGHLRPEDIKGN